MTYSRAEAAHFALGTDLIALAEAIAKADYGVDLTALNPDDFEAACGTLAELAHELAQGLAEAAYRRQTWA